MQRLTYNGEVHSLFPRRRVPEVHPAPIDPLVRAPQPVDGEVSWIRRRDEKSSWSQCSGRRPEAGVAELPATTHVEAATVETEWPPSPCCNQEPLTGSRFRGRDGLARAEVYGRAINARCIINQRRLISYNMEFYRSYSLTVNGHKTLETNPRWEYALPLIGVNLS